METKFLANWLKEKEGSKYTDEKRTSSMIMCLISPDYQPKSLGYQNQNL